MQNLTIHVLPHLKDHRIQPVADPADRQKLLWNIGSLILPVRPEEQLLGLFESNTPLALRRLLFRTSKLKRI